MKQILTSVIVATSLLVIARTASAQILFTDNFTVTSGNSQNVNQDINTSGRQNGTLAPQLYTLGALHHQVGNTATNVGQPNVSDGNYVLLAFSGNFQLNLDIASSSAGGPLVIGFDMYNHGDNPSHGAFNATDWVAFTLRGTGDAFPVAGNGEFGFLSRYNGAIQAFQGGNSGITPAGWDTAGFALDPHWSLTFSDTAGTGSAFLGNGSRVTLVNGATTLGTITLGQLNSSGLRVGFRNEKEVFGGIDNLSVAVVPEPSAAILLSAGLGLLALRRRRA